MWAQGAFLLVIVGIAGCSCGHDSPFKSWSYCDCIGSWCKVANLASYSWSHYLMLIPLSIVPYTGFYGGKLHVKGSYSPMHFVPSYELFLMYS